MWTGEGLGLGAGQQREDTADQLLVVLDVVLEDPQLLQLDQIDGAEGLAGLHGPERDGLEARAAGFRPVGYQHEVEVRPLAAGHVEDRALAPLVLDRHELIGRRAILHLDQELATAVGTLVGGDPEVRAEVLAPEPERRGVVAEGLYLIASAPEDGLDQGLSYTALDLEQIHDPPRYGGRG